MVQGKNSNLLVERISGRRIYILDGFMRVLDYCPSFQKTIEKLASLFFHVFLHYEFVCIEFAKF